MDIKRLYQLRQGEEFLVRAGIPANQRQVIDQRLGEKALLNIIGIIGIAVPLGKLVGGVAHDGGQVDIGRDLPAQRRVQVIVTGRGGKVLHAAHDMGDTHEVVVDDVGEVIGGHAVLLDEDHVVHGFRILEGHLAENRVGIAGFAFGGRIHPDGPRDAGIQLLLYFFLAQVQAVLVVFPGAARCFHLCLPLLDFLLGAEAVIGMAGFDQLLCIGEIGILALGLDVGTAGAADIGTFIPVKAAGAEGIVDHFGGAFHKTLLVSILNAQDELAIVLLGEEISVKRGAHAAQVHETGGAGGETGTNSHGKQLLLVE